MMGLGSNCGQSSWFEFSSMNVEFTRIFLQAVSGPATNLNCS